MSEKEIKIVCSDCGKEIKDKNFCVDEYDNIICRDCATSKYHNCRDCSKLIKKTKKYCDRCNGEIYRNNINSYSTKPDSTFKNYKLNNDKDMNRVYYGMELEISYLNPYIAKGLFKDLYNNKFIYNKSDSSLTEGVEIVTSPCDMRSVKYLLSKMKHGLEWLKSFESDYCRNAGIHIHVSKKMISPFDMIKLYKLLNSYTIKSADDKKAILYLSGRITNLDLQLDEDGVSHYCRIGKCNKDITEMYNMKCVDIQDRYQAVNMQNEHTIEFRLFKTTLDADRILSYFEVVNTMIKYVNTTGIDDISVCNYIDYLSKNTDNKILLELISNINSKLSLKHISCNNVRSIIYDKLKNVNWRKYDNLMKYRDMKLNNYYLAENIDRMLEGTCSHSPRTIFDDDNEPIKINPIISTLLDTYKKVLISKLLRGTKKCV